jgi:D-xylose transport system substrate-binding protein
MKRLAAAMLAAMAMSLVPATGALAAGKTIAASWKTLREERWKIDEAAIEAVVEAAGNAYVATDAQGSAARQLADIEGLISRGVDVILVVAADADAILPAYQSAAAAGVKMLSYDVLVEHPGALWVSFDNVGAGRLMAGEIQKVVAEGDYAFIKGDRNDTSASFVSRGVGEVLEALIGAGGIRNVCETFTEGWTPGNARKNMEQCLISVDNQVDAVISGSDGIAGGVVAALEAQRLAGVVPVSGQGGDHAALNRIALGTQTVSVLKDSRVLGKTAAEAANAMAEGADTASLPGVRRFSAGPGGIEVDAILIEAEPITRANLEAVIDSGWTTREKVCQGVPAGIVPACG